MTYTVAVNGLRLYAYHGVDEQERRVGNTFVVDIAVQAPLQRAVDTDDVACTISYAEIVEIAREVMARPSRLLEHVAGRLHRALMDRWPSITSGTVTIAKLTPPLPNTLLHSASFTLTW